MSQRSLATLNTRGVPLLGSRRRRQYRTIAEEFEASEVEVVNFQEVQTYYHLRQLVRSMPSYRHVSYRRSGVGSALAGVIDSLPGPTVVCGDFNVPREPPLVSDHPGLGVQLLISDQRLAN